jgi:2'-hydroxyisoflavone reductase
LISTVSVYLDFAARVDGAGEGDPVQEYSADDDAFSASPTPEYGALKALCEHEAERWFPGQTLVVCPTYIVGPGDAIGAFTYWGVSSPSGFPSTTTR